MMFACPATDDFFRSRIDKMIGLCHLLSVFVSWMPWQEIETQVAHLFVHKTKASQAGRPRIPLQGMISPLYLKHAFNESDEGVVEC